MRVFVAMLFVAVIALAVRADGAVFNFDMNADPTDLASVDLDGNSSADLSAWTLNGGSMSVSGGMLTIDAAGTKYAGYTTDAGSTPNAIWQNVGGSVAGGYEIETRLKVDSSTGANGALYLGVRPKPAGQTTDGVLLWIGATGQSWGGSAQGLGLGTEDNSSEFHTFRIVAAPGGGDGAYSVYRDGALLAGGLNSGQSGDGGAPAFELGALASSCHGVTQVDYLSFTVVPEPGTLTLAGMGLIGLLAYAWKKRK
jgi:hypothetical protein